jgi:deoxycytidine triphosphate deaminase
MTSSLDDPKFVARFRDGPARSQEDAEDRFRRTANQDPFPLIPAALLNSSDFYNYAAATGIVCPFEEEQLKSACYAIRIGDQVRYWDGDNKSKDIILSAKQVFEVPANSIAFIKTKEKFRLPPYIAMRFNLNINNVHRGILLGTGPVVDPGFEGHLLIPLHNLTTSTYYFHEGEPFIWAEFTKVSPHPLWDSSAHGRYARYDLHNKYRPFPDNKKSIHPAEYLQNASKTSVVSSIAGTISELKRFKNNVTYSAIIGVCVTVILFFIGVVSGFEAPLRDLKGDVAAANEREIMATEVRTRDETLLSDLGQEVGSVREQLAALSARNDQGRISALEGRINQLESKLQQLTAQLTSPKK